MLLLCFHFRSHFQAIGTELQQIGRNSYDKNKPVALSGDIANLIIVLPGYQTEIAYKKFGGKSRLVVGVDTMSKVISKKTALGVIQNEVGRGGSTEITQANHKSAIKMKLVGTTVFTSYDILNLFFPLFVGYYFLFPYFLFRVLSDFASHS
jgi:hypothetical protein